VRVPEARGVRIVRRKHERSGVLLSAEGNGAQSWAFGVEADGGPLYVQGEHARKVAGVVLARLNQTGGGPGVVRRAVERLECAADCTRLFVESRGPTRPTGSTLATAPGKRN
jgi:hypothetical protein